VGWSLVNYGQQVQKTEAAGANEADAVRQNIKHDDDIRQ